MKPRQYQCRGCNRFSRTRSGKLNKCPVCHSPDLRRIYAAATPGEDRGYKGSRLVLSRARGQRLKQQRAMKEIEARERRGDQ